MAQSIAERFMDAWVRGMKPRDASTFARGPNAAGVMLLPPIDTILRHGNAKRRARESPK